MLISMAEIKIVRVTNWWGWRERGFVHSLLVGLCKGTAFLENSLSLIKWVMHTPIAHSGIYPQEIKTYVTKACAKLFIDLFRTAKHWKNYWHSLMGSTHGLQPWECQGWTVGAQGNVDAFPCRHSEWMPVPKGYLPHDSCLGHSWNDKRVGMENRSAVAHLPPDPGWSTGSSCIWTWAFSLELYCLLS